MNKQRKFILTFDTLIILFIYIPVMYLYTLVVSDVVIKILFAILAGLKLYDVTYKFYKYLTKEFESKEE